MNTESTTRVEIARRVVTTALNLEGATMTGDEFATLLHTLAADFSARSEAKLPADGLSTQPPIRVAAPE